MNKSYKSMSREEFRKWISECFPGREFIDKEIKHYEDALKLKEMYPRWEEFWPKDKDDIRRFAEGKEKEWKEYKNSVD